MCLAQITIRQDNGKVVSFPCGKCLECVKKYQNHWSMRLTEEYKDWKYCYFLTLTYRDENLSYVPLKFDTTLYNETDKYAVYGDYRGHRIKVHDDELGQDLFYIDMDATAEDRFLFVTEQIEKMPLNGNLSRLRAQKDNPFSAYLDVERITEDIKVPMVSRVDIQKWLKRVRIAYKREHRRNMPFKYFLTSEYGPQTLRPHYHMMIFTDLEVQYISEYFVEKWEDTYGRVDWKMQQIDKPEHVSKYVSKYCLKPAEFENPYVVAGLIPKSFRLASQGIGKTYKLNLMKEVENLKKEIPVYIKGYEYVNEYDKEQDYYDTYKDDFVVDFDLPADEFNESMLLFDEFNEEVEHVDKQWFTATRHNNPQIVNPEFVEALYEKLRYYENGYFYGIPRYWKDSVFPHSYKEGYRYDKKNKEFKKYFRYDKDTEHNISMAFTEYMEKRYIEDLQKYEEQAKAELPLGTDMEIIHRAEILHQQDLDERTRQSWKNLYKRYYKSYLKNDL